MPALSAVLRVRACACVRVRARACACVRVCVLLQVVSSLRHHAEKKALAQLLRSSARELTLRVNLKVCADCHLFLGCAARHLRRCSRHVKDECTCRRPV